MKGLQLNLAQSIFLVVAFVLFAVCMFAAGTRCSSGPPPVIVPGGVDAGPGEQQIADRVDAAIQRERAEIERIEREYEADIAAFNAAQREKYEELQQQDLDTVVEYLRRWHEQRNPR